ncbi:tyrosine-protein phosphatase non-receptor type 13-like isoform X2 [Amphibalanus amphitrite]|uniref:tyrosine-protein phosphatase non-receptor type 13-like isoform X2 n=1 Tax=Amphibalanus amphitrite TaxID=1232801 RepID=UPI001C902C6A|nr:tyrosine-protein phosphatase non-receptor type 13-like isoform X2 [Amphibalanus amphitrite]
MVDYARRKPNILLSTYGEGVCGRRGCLPAQRERLALHQLTADRGEERLRYLVTLPGPETEPEPGHKLAPEPESGPGPGLGSEFGLESESKSGSESGEESGDDSGQELEFREDAIERYFAGSPGLGSVRGSWLEPLQDCSSEGSRKDAYLHHHRKKETKPEVTWQVTVCRGSRGLGLSVESAPGAAGLVRVKKVFPYQPAALTGRIRPGDVLLSVNEMPVRGLSVQEVLHVLRLAGSEVLLSLSRPADDSCGPPTDSSDSDSTGSVSESRVSPEPGGESESGSASREGLRLPLDTDNYGTFAVELQKVNNTLGLSLRRTDDTVLGHTIRAKVREPAISDPRVRVGDKLIKVNGIDTTAMSHAEVVSLLRRCSERVTLTLYRDGMATPGSPGSPVSSRSTRLRPEAVEMLTGLAFRRERSLPPSGELSPGCSGTAPELGRRRSRAEQVRRLSCGSRGSPRLRRKRMTPSPDVTDSTDPFSRLSGVDDMDAVTSERLDQLTRISESSALADSDPVTSDQLEQMTSQLSRVQETSDAAASDEWQDSGEDSDAELHERHLRRVAVEGAAEGVGSGRSRQLYLSVQPQQRVKSGRTLKRISSEERLEDGAASPEVGGQLGKWKGFNLDSSVELDADPTLGVETGLRGQSLNIQLRRGWSVRLGFSLHSTDGSHVVSQIHPDSVAERDGRLRVGDVLTKVNDTSVRDMTSDQVIDLLRKTKGAISLSVVRL